MLRVRRAETADSIAMSAIRAASISQLCGADHGDDPVAVGNWVANQSAATFSALLGRSDVALLVAELEGVPVGVGCISGDKVTLNYVHPDYRFRGVSKALMAGLEAELVASGVTLGRLHSTVTALAFYRALGWIETGPGDPEQGHPMQKRL